MQLEVLYEDNHLLVVNKPAGILTQPSGTDQDSLHDQAKLWIKQKYNKPGNVFLEPIHRIDRPVSGIVVFARTSKALSRLNEAIREHKTEKWYLALVEGVPNQSEASLENYLFHDDFHARVVGKTYPGAKLAKLAYKIVEKRGSAALLEVNLETGRYHQIRAQLSNMGHPIVFDEKYGARSGRRGKTIALHHHKMAFPHPVTQELITIQAKNKKF
jgi:23S rRNA pseudouridine1911/1915/1917 synthase